MVATFVATAIRLVMRPTSLGWRDVFENYINRRVRQYVKVPFGYGLMVIPDVTTPVKETQLATPKTCLPAREPGAR